MRPLNYTCNVIAVLSPMSIQMKTGFALTLIWLLIPTDPIDLRVYKHNNTFLASPSLLFIYVCYFDGLASKSIYPGSSLPSSVSPILHTNFDRENCLSCCSSASRALQPPKKNSHQCETFHLHRIFF
ncbi:hypothetical protein BDV97DRAFT_53749 [Delphinella strobiligena]|nr:hypothetical protein BDV97DRAFT_53749 [Delphinella strobiligena]